MKYSGAFDVYHKMYDDYDSDWGDNTKHSFGTGECVYITKVIYNQPATIVFWSDNTKTVSKCDPRDSFDKQVGLSLCVLKKLVGSSKIKNCYKDWCTDSNVTTIRDVRKLSKNAC